MKIKMVRHRRTLLTDDYYNAMNRVEQRLVLVDQPIEITPSILHPQLSSLIEQLFAPCLSEESRIKIAGQIKKMIVNDGMNQDFQSQVSRPP
jgi:hypothetical protein